jgi:hypothetical protein
VGTWVAHNISQGKDVLFNSMTRSCKILRGTQVVGGAHFENGLWIVEAQGKMRRGERKRGLELAHGVDKLEGLSPK